MTIYEQIAADPPTIVAHGATPEELFEHAATGMYGVAHDLSAVPPTYSRPIVAPGDDHPELLRNWLDELLYVAAQEALVWSSFMVDRLEEGGILGSAAGMPAAQVPAPEVVITAVDAIPSGLVPVPEGWWAEIRFRTGPGLRLL